MTQILQIGDTVTLMCGDVADIIASLPSKHFHLVFCDETMSVNEAHRLSRRYVALGRNQLRHDVYDHMIERETEAGDIMLDPALGDGLLAVAAIKTGRAFVGLTDNPKTLDKVAAMLKPLVENGGSQIAHCRIS